ncbi:MAG: lamin tail domain-containing protein [Akkermansiaceae bacterium]
MSLFGLIPSLKAADSIVVFNEIHYHPIVGGGDTEWVELRNLNGVDVDISGWRIRGGIDFDFAEGTVIDGHGYLIVAADPSHATLAGLGALGPFTGLLSNSGEVIRIENRNDRTMDSVSYDDDGDWPVGADGSGATLVKLNGESADAKPAAWAASPDLGGSPGAANFPSGPPAPELALSEVAAAGSLPFQVEVTNLSGADIDLSNYRIILSSGGIFDFPSGVLPSGGFQFFNEATLGFVPVDGDRLFLLRAGDSKLADARAVTGRLRGLTDGGDWGYPSSATFGTANLFALEDSIVINEIYYDGSGLAPEPAVSATFEETELISISAPWRFNEAGADLPSDWATNEHPVGGDWETGAGIIAFENSGTDFPIGTALSFPAFNSPFVITYYFETDFTLTAGDLSNIDTITLDHYVDDGAIFYINGVEFERYGMLDGPVDFETTANRGDEAELVEGIQIPMEHLQVGSNRISVEVHQTSSTSSDIVFGARVNANQLLTPEIPAQPFRKTSEQWIELHNRGAASVDLSNWEFSDGIDFTFPFGTSLDAGGYLLVVADLASFSAKYPSAPVAGEFGGSLSRSGERLILRDANKSTADEVRFFNGGRWPALADSGGASLELRDPDADNSLAESWSASETADLGSWETFTYRGRATPANGDPGVDYHEFIFGLLDSGSVMIDDISVIEDPDGNARQLIQNGDFQGGDSDKWRLLGTHQFGSVVLDPDSPGNNVLRINATGATEHMSNHAETTLKSGNTFITTSSTLDYEISFRARWVGGSNHLNTRLFFNRLARSHRLSIGDEQGTPGAANSRLETNVGPAYAELSHSPAVPAAGSPCTVTVTPSDPDGVSGLTLRYSVNGGSFSSLTMDDGGGTWSGVIPAQSSGAIVQFYIDAVDGLGATSTFPREGQASRNLIPWQDGQAVNSLAGGAQPNNFRIVLTQADVDEMHQLTDIMSNHRLPCTVIYNESDIYYGAKVRIKGSEHTRFNNARIGYNLRFAPHDLFLGAHKSVAIDRSGGNGYGQHEMLLKHVLNRVGGIPGSYDDLIHCIAPLSPHSGGVHNDPVMTGAAILLKSRFDSEFLDNRWSNGGDGMLFKYELTYPLETTSTGGPEGFKLAQATGSLVGRARVTDLGGDQELYRWHYLVRNGRSADDFTGIMELAKATGLSSGSAGYHDRFNELMDTDRYLRASAFQNILGVTDTLNTGQDHNALFYQRPSDGRFIFIPWDMDQQSASGRIGPINTNTDLTKLIANPANERAYYSHIREMAREAYNPTYLTEWANHYSNFIPGQNTRSLPNQNNNDKLMTQYSGRANSLFSGGGTFESRVDTVLAQRVAQVIFRFTTGNGASVDSSFYEVGGNGWIDVDEIRITGSTEPLVLEWIDDNSWRTQLPVQPGANSVTIQAFGVDGNVIGSDTITFTGTNTIIPADASNLVVSELMYHPAEPSADEMDFGFTDQDEFEFIEFMNIAAEPITLAGVQMTGGIIFAFDDTVVQPGERVVIAANPVALTMRYGSGATVIGNYADGGRLRNSGETFTIIDGSGAIIKSFDYSDDAPWPAAADGDDYSLVLIAPETNPNHALPSSWRHSSLPGGNAGGSDSTPFSGGDLIAYALVGDGDLALTPTHGSGVSFSFVRDLAADDAVYSVEISSDLETWNVADASFPLTSESPDGAGGSLVTFAAPSESSSRLFVRLRVQQK